MEDIDASSLDVAKSSFLSLLSKVDPCESASFVEWVIQHCSIVNTAGNTGETANYASMNSAEKILTEIVKDIKKRVPLQGIMASENISLPEDGEVTSCGKQGLYCPGNVEPTFRVQHIPRGGGGRNRGLPCQSERQGCLLENLKRTPKM